MPRRIPPVVWLVGPSVLFMALLFGWPMIAGVVAAFAGPEGFTLDHVSRMVADPYFWPAARCWSRGTTSPGSSAPPPRGPTTG